MFETLFGDGLPTHRSDHQGWLVLAVGWGLAALAGARHGLKKRGWL